MPTIGVILEGVHDEAAIPVFVRRCGGGPKVVTRKCRGTVLGRFRGLVTQLLDVDGVDKILLVSDADGKDPSEIVRSFRDQGIRKYRIPIVPVVIVEELEAWLLADPEALARVIGVRKEFKSPENLRDPKRALERLLPDNVLYTPQMAR
jgi:hypothetical protein